MFHRISIPSCLIVFVGYCLDIHITTAAIPKLGDKSNKIILYTHQLNEQKLQRAQKNKKSVSCCQETDDIL